MADEKADNADKLSVFLPSAQRLNEKICILYDTLCIINYGLKI